MRQNSAAGNTSLSRPILQVGTVWELMCSWISVFFWQMETAVFVRLLSNC